MNKKHFITVTLLVSALAFNPLVANELYLNHTNSQRQINTISSQISSILFNRGLDEEVAEGLSEELIEDNELFEAMLSNLLNHYPELSSDEIFEYLGTAALYRKKVDLSAYDHLVGMVTELKGQSLSKNDLARLRLVSKFNALIA